MRLLQTLHDLYTVYYRLDGLCDSYYGRRLVRRPVCSEVFDLQLYKDGLLLLGPDPANPSEPRRPVSQEKMYKSVHRLPALQLPSVGVSNCGDTGCGQRPDGDADQCQRGAP